MEQPLEDVRFADKDHWDFAVEVHLFVRKKARPDAVRIFLDALEEANAYVSRPENTQEIATVCVHKLKSWRLQRSMVTGVLDREKARYEIGELDQWITRHLWRREVAQIKAGGS